MGIDVFEMYAKVLADTSQYESALGKAANMGKSVMGGIGKIAKVGMGVAAAAIGTGTAAMSVFGKGALDAYANYEQLEGGIQKLYGESDKATAKMMENAKKAYKTAGMSANEYMDTAMQFSASLIQSLDGDLETAANMTDVAMQSISDNVNTFGTDMESVSNAFKGFSKANFTMLDNLKLGYGGTKEEMERLLRDAEQYEGFMENSLSIDNFNDIITAIDIVQEHLNIAGTTGREAMTTIEGSATMTKAAWENLKLAIGSGEGVTEAFTGLKEAIFGVGLTEDGKETGLLNQIVPRIQTIMSGAGDAIVESAPLIADKLPELIEAVLPPMIDGGIALAGAIGSGLLQALPSVWDSVSTAAGTIGDKIYKGLEKAAEMTEDVDFATPIGTALDKVDSVINGDKVQTFIDNGVSVVTNIATGIGNAAPDVIPKAAEVVSNFVDGITDNIPQIIDAGVAMFEGLIIGLVKALPTIIMIPIKIKLAFIQHFVEMGQQLLSKVMDIFPKVVSKVQEFLAQLPEKMRYWGAYAVTTIVLEFYYLPIRIAKLLKQVIDKAIEFGKDLKDKGKKAAEDFRDGLIDILTHLPEKMAEWGKNIGQALVDGFKSIAGGIGDLISGAKDAAKDFVDRNDLNAVKAGAFSFVEMESIGGDNETGIGIDYELLANAIVRAFIAADIGIECDDREFGRLVRKAVMA